ncbi:unnamed protein product [Paramecium sonneborni]|uniref:Uncharacterized protein n=1 Tax=Paramecium sonneborni TaxID=65129 RepID=A0A8S1QZE8_9CILI|nr:unnamed protein product [Paramecium sonneborni]
MFNYKSVSFSNYFDFYLENRPYTSYQSITQVYNCGGEHLRVISLTQKHNRRALWIYMSFNEGGLYQFQLSISKCQYECAGCIENYQKFSLSWKLHQYSFDQKLITNSDGWTFVSQYNYQTYFLCGNCNFLKFMEIRYSTQLPPHQDVLIRFFKASSFNLIVDYQCGKKTISSINQQVEIFINNHIDLFLQLNIKTQPTSSDSEIRDFEVFYTEPEIRINNFNEGCLEQIGDKCIICQEGWELDEFLENCHPFCGDGIIKGQEECDDSNKIFSDSCYQCKYSCKEFCQICQFGICQQYQDGIQSQLEMRTNNLNEGCLQYIDDKCLLCQKGWVQNKFLENCHPICGDGITQGYEECDDGDRISYDSCYLCKYACINFCLICQFGICQQCEEGFVINGNFNCDPLCGDGNLIPYSAEQCELTVNEVWDGCQDCRFISIEHCKTNKFSICLECEVGFFMIDNICLPYCGDKFILEQYEDCDDGNQQPYDGCFQCQFQCSEDCKICDRGQCILKCEDGYEFVKNSCLSVCGDQIVTKEEDCDDGNLKPYDGCFDCSYSCPKNCYECFQGTCLECNYQYQLLISNQCKQQLNCGDGFLQENEECDDGNYYAMDGCKDCLIEQNWICITIIKDSQSQCTFVKTPNLVINYLNMTNNKQYISIMFDQKVKIDTFQPLSETINFELSNIDKKNWNSTLYIIQDIGSEVSFGEFIVQIEVYQLLDFRPILKIQVNQIITNQYNAVLKEVEKSITLKYPTFIDETQEDYSYNLKSLNQNLIYLLAGIVVVNLLQGNGDLFVEILAILQFQQYLKYINLQYPENLEIYFSLYDLITIEPLLDLIYFPQLLQFIDFQTYQEYSQGKFNFYKQNSSIIINLSCQIFQLLIFLLLILLLQQIKKVLYNWIFCPRFFYGMSRLSLYLKPKITLKLSQSLYNFFMDLIKLEKLMSFQGLQKALLLNGWDMIFKTLLYTRSSQIQDYIDIAQIIIASILLFIDFSILLDYFKGKQKLQKANNYQRFQILSFGRQFFFLFFLIYVQNSQILQLGLLFLTSILQIRFIFFYRRVFNKKNYIVQMVVEISVFTFILTSFLYIDEFNGFFNEEKKIILGWIQAIILSSGLILELIMICYNLLQKLKQKYRRQTKILNNPLFFTLNMSNMKNNYQ